MEFLEYIENTNSSESIDELFAVYKKAIEQHGLDRVLFALETDHDSLQLKTGHGIINNYPEDWLNYYFEKGYDKIDPVRCYGIYQHGAFTWGEMKQKMRISKEQDNCLNMGIESGLHNGMAIALRGDPGELAGMALASTEKKDSFDGNIDLISAYTYQFYNVFKKLSQKHIQENYSAGTIKLTKAEYEVLTWMALGKQRRDIADILNISEHTVDFHKRNIFKKLQANSQVLAITKAISMGLIHPYPYK